MSEEKQETTQNNDRLLNEEERAICQRIAQSAEGLMSRRATALLAFDVGSTRAEAGGLAGLTLGQVRYLLARFREKRLGMFPEGVLLRARKLLEEIEQQEEVKKAVKAKKPTKPKKAKKKKKKKKGKGKKKTKKDKKGKKKGKKKKGKKKKSKKGKGKKKKKKSKK